MASVVADENEMLWIYFFGARGAYNALHVLFEVTYSVKTL